MDGIPRTGRRPVVIERCDQRPDSVHAIRRYGPAVSASRYDLGMGDAPIAVDELAAMTPSERAAFLRSRSTDDLDSLRPEFRDRVEERGRQLLRERSGLERA
jgi:hypothetical protein